MCGEDGTQRVVYKLKEEHAEGGAEQKRKKKEKHRQKKKKKKREKELYRLPKRTIVVPTLDFQYMWGWIFLLYKS